MSSRTNGYWLFLTALILFIGPYVAVFAIGTVWMWRQGLVWLWAVGTGVPTLVGLALMERARRILFSPAAQLPHAASASTPTGQAAMQAVRAISQRLQAMNPPLEQPEVLEKVVREVLLEVLETVAEHYYPQADRPALHTPVAHVAALVELVADDFRRTFMRAVPWGKTVTLGRLLWWRQKGNLAWKVSLYLWQMNRIRRMCMRPATALVQEVQDHFGQKLSTNSLSKLKQSAIDYCITKAGEYAIQLYSGGFVLHEEYRPRLSGQVKSIPFDQEPLQVLVVGQVKAGKSSLINALQGERQALVDTLPVSGNVDLYECHPEGLPPIILRDTPGYDAADSDSELCARLRAEIEECDLLVIVCSARSAARRADRELLAEARQAMQRDPKRLMPPFLYVLTHIDTVPQHLAAEATTAVAADFDVPAGQIVPLCAQWGRVSNLEFLVAAIDAALPEAERLKVSRCIRQIRQEQDEDKIIRQILNGIRLAGGWVVNKR